MNPFDQIAELKTSLAALQAKFDTMSAQFYKNNFSTHQDFTKDSSFSISLKIPVYSTLPSCEAGQICAYSTGGTYKLMIATASDTWTVVGTQS